MNNYYEEIEHLIKRNEVNKKARVLEDNSDTLKTYWEIGKLIVEAQGGEKRAKYGNELIKEWAKKLTLEYGSNYSDRKLRDYRNFYTTFLNWHPVGAISWSHIRLLLPIKDENKRNYYINLCINHNLSKRELIKEIKSNSFERLVDVPKKIDIVIPKKNITIKTNMKNPIVFYLKENETIKNEKDLEMLFLSQLQSVFRQLGGGYAYIENQYKFILGNKSYYIDLLLFNIELNSYVVIELKLRELRKEDKAQIKFYMDYIDKYVKKAFHNKTYGIIISKEQDKFIATFVSEEDIIPITYMLEKGEHICE